MRIRLVVIVLMASACDYTDNNMEDPMFELWCGDTLCAWTVEQGSIQKVGTWHPEDPGVDLIGNPVVISQTIRTQSSVWVQALSQVDAGVRVTVELDFGDDGTVDDAHDISSTDWQPVEYAVPSTSSSARLVVRKLGTGRAVVSRVHAYADVYFDPCDDWYGCGD